MYRDAIRHAFTSWKYIDGMMQYARRYKDQDFNSIETIDIILDYAPLLLNMTLLDELEALLKGYRRIDKNTDVNIRNRLVTARELMWKAHRLWHEIDRSANTNQSGLRKRLGGDQSEWREIISAWESMGLVNKTPLGRSYQLELTTSTGTITRGKCSSCGSIAKAPKAFYLEKAKCPSCSETSMFVLLRPERE